MNTINPPRLKRGDTISLVSLSSGFAKFVPHRVKQAIACLESIGLKTKIGQHALENIGYTSASAKDRANDLMNAFLDQETNAIMSFIGGYSSIEILHYLNFDLIAKNPKIFIGYSDTTIPLLAIYNQTGLTTYYGPAALTQFGEYPNILAYTLEYFLKALTQDYIGQIKPSDIWTDELLDWTQKLDQTRPRLTYPNAGFQWLKDGEAEGPLLGGCLVSLTSLAGTKYWPNFEDKLFFWETPESDGDMANGIPLGKIIDSLGHLRELGVFDKIAGMVIGRPVGYKESDQVELIKHLKTFFSEYKFPILYNANIGHCDPIISIPIGRIGVINSENNKFFIN